MRNKLSKKIPSRKETVCHWCDVLKVFVGGARGARRSGGRGRARGGRGVCGEGRAVYVSILNAYVGICGMRWNINLPGDIVAMTRDPEFGFGWELANCFRWRFCAWFLKLWKVNVLRNSKKKTFNSTPSVSAGGRTFCFVYHMVDGSKSSPPWAPEYWPGFWPDFWPDFWPGF